MSGPSAKAARRGGAGTDALFKGAVVKLQSRPV